jgi:hypothetical protein
MALYITKHPVGPELPEAFKNKTFRSYVNMADFADDNKLPHGIYWIRNTSGTNLATAIRELRYHCGYGGFWVEGYGNI